jgi:hypothetical protein
VQVTDYISCQKSSSGVLFFNFISQQVVAALRAWVERSCAVPLLGKNSIYLLSINSHVAAGRNIIYKTLYMERRCTSALIKPRALARAYALLSKPKHTTHYQPLCFGACKITNTGGSRIQAKINLHSSQSSVGGNASIYEIQIQNSQQI